MLFFTISIRQIARLGLFYKTQNSVGTFVIDFKTKTVELQGFSIQVGIWVKANRIPQKEPCFSEFLPASGEFIRLLWKR